MAQRYILTERTATQRGERRVGLNTQVVSRVDSRVIDDKIVSTATIPFIRSRFITYVGRNFKPNTRLYAFFDEVDVSKYITPAANVTVTRPGGTGAGAGSFDFESSAEQYGEENVLGGRRISGNVTVSAFNKGDLVYVDLRSSTPYTLLNTPASGVLTYYGAGNVMYLTNIKGNFQSGDRVVGTISGANATLNSAVTSPTIGSNVITSSAGEVAGTFFIPNTDFLRFRTGTREFVLTDSSTNSPILADTSGRTNYRAVGTLQTRQVTWESVRNADVVTTEVTEERTVTDTSERIIGDTGWFDPLAQTFIVDIKNGCFLTKVDIFFSKKDTTLPVTLEIRNTVNGYPGRRTLPFSKVILNPEDIVVSDNATKATTFTFKSPVYVQENEEYCIVLISDSVEYKVWISTLGENEIGTDRRISKQPYMGVLFKSQNASTWTADQLQDLKFVLYRAQFDTSVTGKVNFVNDQIAPGKLPLDGLNFTNNSSVITIVQPSHGMLDGSSVKITGFDGAYNIPAANVNATHLVGNATIDTYTITVGNVANQSISHVSGNIFATRDIVFNVMQPIIEYRDYPGTSITFKANVTSGTVVTGAKESPVTIIANENNYFASPKAVKSVVNENAASGVGRKSLEIESILTTTADNLSPVIDLNRSSAILTLNRINNATEVNVRFTHDVTTVLSANSNISLSGNVITTDNPTVANILGTLHVGKSLQISSNAGVNANVIISKVSNDFAGNANVEVYYTTFATQGTRANVVTLVQRNSFVDERAYLGGTAAAKYVTRAVNLQYPSKFIKILFSANVPKEGAIDVYYRTLDLGSLQPLLLKNYTQATPLNTIPTTENPELYTDVEYEIDDLPLFNALTVKIVFRSSNSSQIPSIKDLRIVACP
jgi:hypothetical protein